MRPQLRSQIRASESMRNLCGMVVFPSIIFLQLWRAIAFKFAQVCCFIQVEIHQVRKLVFEKLTKVSSAFKQQGIHNGRTYNHISWPPWCPNWCVVYLSNRYPHCIHTSCVFPCSNGPLIRPRWLSVKTSVKPLQGKQNNKKKQWFFNKVFVLGQPTELINSEFNGSGHYW